MILPPINIIHDATQYVKKLSEISSEIELEVLRAKRKHTRNFNSPHEGYAVILEEVDELWDEVKAKNFDKEKARTEAIQIAAMCYRFINELT